MTGFDDYEGEEREEDGDGDISEEPRSGPLNAAGGFRLRRPPPVSPEEQAKLDAKAAALAARELEQQEKRKLKRQLEKNEYLPFSFEDEEETAESDQIFTSKTFSDIGVSDKIILRNLERMGIFNPTKIQEAAIPEMLSGKDVVLYAQTGSGKTLSFLLPLVNVVDPSVRKVR
jgi:superfamily II RNA helicase